MDDLILSSKFNTAFSAFFSPALITLATLKTASEKTAPLLFPGNTKQALRPEIFKYNDCPTGQFTKRNLEYKTVYIELALIFPCLPAGRFDYFLCIKAKKVTILTVYRTFTILKKYLCLS